MIGHAYFSRGKDHLLAIEPAPSPILGRYSQPMTLFDLCTLFPLMIQFPNSVHPYTPFFLPLLTPLLGTPGDHPAGMTGTTPTILANRQEYSNANAKVLYNVIQPEHCML